MESNGATVLRDADVEKIIGAHFVTDAQGAAKLSYLVILRGKEQAELRPLAQCASPDAIHGYEQRYSKAKWELSAYEESLSGASGEVFDAAEHGCGSTDVADEQSSHGSSDDNDSHLDHIDSDDSYWEDVDDEQGRPGTDPEARAEIRAAWAASDETYRVAESDAKDEQSAESGSDEVSEPTVHSKSETSKDSLLEELEKAPQVSPAVQHRARRYEAVQGSKRRRLVEAYLGDADDDSDNENEAPKDVNRKRPAARKLSFRVATPPGGASFSQASFGSVPPLPNYSEASQRKFKTETFSSEDDASRDEKRKEVVVLSSNDDQGDAKKQNEVEVITLD